MLPVALARRSVLTGLPLLIMSTVTKPSLTYAQMRVAETTLISSRKTCQRIVSTIAP